MFKSISWYDWPIRSSYVAMPTYTTPEHVISSNAISVYGKLGKTGSR